MSEKILKQFKTLRRVTPSNVWQENTRTVLMESVKKFNLTNNGFRDPQNNGAEKWLTFFYSLRGLLPRPSRVVGFAVLAAIIGGGAFATQASTPKNKTFYKIKEFYEKVELASAGTPEDELKVLLKHAETRKAEMDQLIADSKDDNPAEVASNIATVVLSLQKNQTSVGNTLDTIEASATKGDKSETVALAAQTVAKNSQQAIETLETVKQVSDPNLAAAVNKATATVEEVQDVSLKILADNVTEIVAASTTPAVSPLTPINDLQSDTAIHPEELKNIINKKIERVDQKIKDVTDKLDASLASDNVSTTTVQTSTAKGLIVDLKNTSAAAQQKLNEAKEDLNNGSVVTALNKINQTTDLVKASVKVINAAETASVAKDPVKSITATGTPTIVPKATEEKALLKSSVQELSADDATTTPQEVIDGKTDEFGQEIGNITDSATQATGAIKVLLQP